MNDNLYSRGSEWRKWDIHVHSPASDNYKGSYDQFISQIETSDCAVVGINDYCSVEGYKQFLARVPKSNKVILPVVEFRMTNILLNKNSSNGRRINFHVIFSNQIDVNDIENFLKSLTVNGTQLSSKYSDSKYLYEQGSVDFNAIEPILRSNPTFKDKCLILMPYDEYGGIDNIDPVNDQWFKLNLINRSHFIGSSNLKQIEFFLWQNDKFKEEEYKKWFQDKKACIKGSDSHDHSYPVGSLMDEKSQPSDKCCWIKADPTFEGLRQVVNEPADRIFIGNVPPKLQDVENNKSHYIDSISLKSVNSSEHHTWFDDNIPINSGLVAIIGKKGSGKSAQADSMALAGKSHTLPGNYSFLRDDKFKKKGLAKQYEATLTWCDGLAVKCNLNDEVNVETEPEQVKYLPQKFVETICNESGIDLFQQEIDKVIFSYVPEENKNDTTSLKELIKLKTGLIDRNVETLKQRITEQNELICKLEDKQLPTYLEFLKKQLAGKQRELKNIIEPKKVVEPKSKPSKDAEIKINSLNTDLEKIEKEITEKQTELKIVNQHITKLQNLEISLSSLKKQIDEFLTNHDSDLRLLKIDPKKLISINVDYNIITIKKAKLSDDNKKLIALLSDEGNIKTSLVVKKKGIIGELKKIYDSLDKENNAYREYLKAFKSYQDKKAAIEGTDEDTSLTTIKSITKEIDYVQKTLNTDIKAAEDKRENLVGQIYDELDRKIAFYNEVYAPLGKVIKDKKEKQKKTGNVLDFNVGIVFDKLNFPQEFLSYIDQSRDGSFQGKPEGLARVKETISNNNLKTKQGIIEFVKELINSLKVDKSAKDTPKLLDDQLIKSDGKKQELYDYLYGLKYLEVKYNITFNGKDLNENEFSPGEIGALLLIFYLLIDKDKIPLIIDQPEENLDNESVFTLLVPYIKQAKRERQIIIVTHNPNLAVVCDAEQIISAEMDKHTYEIRYTSGSIENPATNKKVLDVLEGTLPAFSKRDQKYLREIV